MPGALELFLLFLLLIYFLVLGWYLWDALDILENNGNAASTSGTTISVSTTRILFWMTVIIGFLLLFWLLYSLVVYLGFFGGEAEETKVAPVYTTAPATGYVPMNNGSQVLSQRVEEVPLAQRRVVTEVSDPKVVTVPADNVPDREIVRNLGVGPASGATQTGVPQAMVARNMVQ